MDPLKTAIAEAIQDGILPAAIIQRIETNLQVSIEVQKVTPTETLIRVKTDRSGTRYFHVKVREMM